MLRHRRAQRAWGACLLLVGCQQEGNLLDRPPETEVIPDGVYINELMPRNASTVSDDSGGYYDWIELFNHGDDPVSLEGLYLSDDYAEHEPEKYALPALEIEPDGFLLLWADGDGQGGDDHLSLSLDEDGGDVILYSLDEYGNLLLMDGATFGPLGMDVSYGRKIDGGADWITLSEPSPGASNW